MSNRERVRQLKALRVTACRESARRPSPHARRQHYWLRADQLWNRLGDDPGAATMALRPLSETKYCNKMFVLYGKIVCHLF
jgi:hypothetical protein